MSEALDNFRSLVSKTTVWQAITDADEAGALARIYEYGTEEFLDPPIIVVREAETNSRRIADDLYLESGVLDVMIELPRDEEVEFPVGYKATNALLKGFWREVQALGQTSGLLDIADVATDEDLVATGADRSRVAWQASFRVSWPSVGGA